MKKLLSVLFGTIVFGALTLGMGACGNVNGGDELKVYAPDGAPALALLNAIEKEDAKEDETFDFDIVDASSIQTYVTGANPAADLAVLPVNLAAKLLGTGETYQMLGTVTNGNLYFLTAGENPVLTAENASAALTGKKIGVVRLTDVPGLTLQAVLTDLGVDYAILESAQEAGAADRANLVAFAPENVTPNGGCDYYLCPEPAASTKIKGTASAATPFRKAGDLQELYGGSEGYPQAVVVAKNSVIQNRKADVETFIGYLQGSAAYLETVSVANVLELLEEARESGLAPSFNANNLTAEVIANCSVRYTPAAQNKDVVLGFLQKLIAVNSASAAIPQDRFFYLG